MNLKMNFERADAREKILVTLWHLKNEHSLLKFPYCTLNNKYIEHNDGIMRKM